MILWDVTADSARARLVLRGHTDSVPHACIVILYNAGLSILCAKKGERKGEVERREREGGREMGERTRWQAKAIVYENKDIIRVSLISYY